MQGREEISRLCGHPYKDATLGFPLPGKRDDHACNFWHWLGFILSCYNKQIPKHSLSKTDVYFSFTKTGWR